MTIVYKKKALHKKSSSTATLRRLGVYLADLLLKNESSERVKTSEEKLLQL